MDNLIRHYRKLRGLTQTELAQCLGTTTQSVSRLETGVMTLSTDWLERLGAVLRVHPIALLPSIESMGAFNYIVHTANGISQPYPSTLHWAHGASHPVGLHLMCDSGIYRAHSQLIGDKLPHDRAQGAIGRDCIVGLPCGGVGLRRVLAVTNAPLSADMIALNPGAKPEIGVALEWLAPIRAELRVFD